MTASSSRWARSLIQPCLKARTGVRRRLRPMWESRSPDPRSPGRWPSPAITSARPARARRRATRRTRRRRHEHERYQPEARDPPRPRSWPGSSIRRPRRVGDADDVAADVARQKVVEEQADPDRLGQRRRRRRCVARGAAGASATPTTICMNAIRAEGEHEPAGLMALTRSQSAARSIERSTKYEQRGAAPRGVRVSSARSQQLKVRGKNRKGDSTLTV